MTDIVEMNDNERRCSMSETTKQRTDRLMSMSRAELVMHAQDLTRQRDELLALIADDSYAISFQSLRQYRKALSASVKKN